MRFQAQTNEAKRFQRGHLTKKQVDKMIPTVQLMNVIISLVTLYAFVELIFVHKFQHLCKHIFT